MLKFETLSNRDYYLKICFLIERSSFDQFNKFFRKSSTIENTHINMVTIKKINNNQKEKYSWYDEFETLYVEGKEKKIISNILVHGSIGDFTNTKFSDFDFTIYLTNKMLEEEFYFYEYKKWLKKLYRLIFKIDPLQHHGPFYLWDSLVKQYTNNILPLMVYEDTWAMEDIFIKFNVSKYDQNSSLSLSLCKNIKYSEKLLFKYGYNRFAIKRYLSYWMLIPAFYYTDIGKPLKKSESFTPFYKKFIIESKPIEIASTIRANWSTLPSWYTSLAPFFSYNKLTRRASNLLLMDKDMKKIILNELQPGIIQLEKSILDSLCTK